MLDLKKREVLRKGDIGGALRPSLPVSGGILPAHA
jgi:hypothetical protein